MLSTELESSVATAASISVVIPTYRRVDALLWTLKQISRCTPSPLEVIVHVDNGDQETISACADHFPNVRWLTSSERKGPGGGRNLLIQAATAEFIASFDDDSWPMNASFFQDAGDLIAANPQAAVLACEVIESDDARHDSAPGRVSSNDLLTPVGGFVGCGAILRRVAFLQTNGYLPLRNAYGMEESDVSLQLIDGGWSIFHAGGLQVIHACDRGVHHASPKINAAHIRNTALLAFLRYPVNQWPYGFLQVLNRIVFCLRQRRYRGLLSGLASIPMACWRYRHHRVVVERRTVLNVRKLAAQSRLSVNGAGS